MTLDGIWTGEIHSPYGWENSGVYTLENGLMVGGNNRHYSVGRYSVSEKAFEAEIICHYYGPPRTIFGETREQFEITVSGQLGDGVIDTKITRPDREEFSVEFRLTKRMDLPAA